MYCLFGIHRFGISFFTSTIQPSFYPALFNAILSFQFFEITNELMKSEDIRSIQAPIKQKYRDNPESAVITLKASGTIGENLSCKVNTGKAIAEAGLHPATGGNGTQLCSGDMLLEALAACAGVTLNTVAAAIDVDLKDAEVVAEGDLDFRGTLGVSKEAPVGFKEIRLHYNLTTDASDEEITTLLKLTERYCVVFQTLNQANQIQVSHSV